MSRKRKNPPEDFISIDTELPKEGQLVWVIQSWNEQHQSVFGKREDGSPIWYRIEGNTRTLPAVVGWKPYDFEED